MKIQRYLAKDMRSALAQVREALGSDAVILASGRVGEEVEVVAAIDFESQRETVEPLPARAPAAAVRKVDFTKRASSQLSPDVAHFGSHEDDTPPVREPAASETSL